MTDAVLVAVMAVAITITMAVATEPGSRRPDAFAYGLGLATEALLFFRRRWPIGVLLGSVAIMQLYFQLNYPGFFAAVPLSAALYNAAVTGHLRWTLLVAAFYIASPIIFWGLVEPDMILFALNEALRGGILLGAVISLGEAVRSRRAYEAEVAERLRRAEAERARVADELKVAHLVQQQFLPDELPDIPGWRVAAFYRSAREVGGDFYDFTPLPDGTVAITIGDVTDKGAPAALIMATTQGLLRAEAQRAVSPSEVLGRVNEVLVLNTPARMFVTCLYMVLDPKTGHVQYANAGHNLPYLSTDEGVSELRATGTPLGLFPNTIYDEKSATLPPGVTVLLHSDGLAEAHNGDREMLGFPRIIKVMASCGLEDDLIDALLTELDRFTGDRWEQEDDITLVTLQQRP